MTTAGLRPATAAQSDTESGTAIAQSNKGEHPAGFMSKKAHIIRAEKAFEFKHTISHPWNPDTIVPGTQLDRMVGFERIRINVVRIPAGGAASVYHSHQCEEEWIYILQGQAVLDIDGQDHLLGPGDFAGFPERSIPHQLKNPFNKSLVCLIGGEHSPVAISDFPREGKRLYRHGNIMEVYDTSDAVETGPADIDEIVTTSYRKSLRTGLAGDNESTGEFAQTDDD
jgi:uncharacterized cupin superfamily protein